VSASDGTASLKAAEQLANIRVRLAWETIRKGQMQRDKAKVSLAKAKVGGGAAGRKARAASRRSLAGAERTLQMSLNSARQSAKEATILLEELVAIHPTMERESIYGSLWKRVALIEAAAGRPPHEQSAIEAMRLHYRNAVEIGHKDHASDVFYPALNYLAADLCLNAGRRGWKGFDSSIVQSTRTSLEAKNRGDPDFWSIVGETELKLYNAVSEGRLARERERLEKGYEDLHKRVSAPWLWSSVYDTAQFVLRKYSARASDKESRATHALLTYLRRFAQPK
jgi:hypothetical protein